MWFNIAYFQWAAFPFGIHTFFMRVAMKLPHFQNRDHKKVNIFQLLLLEIHKVIRPQTIYDATIKWNDLSLANLRDAKGVSHPNAVLLVEVIELGQTSFLYRPISQKDHDFVPELPHCFLKPWVDSVDFQSNGSFHFMTPKVKDSVVGVFFSFQWGN